ncbi:MAG: alpha/beta fold hydrolase [Thermomicrobiales bacterium]
MLEPLAEHGWPIVFYDQLGCGRSDRPDNPDLWTIDLFLTELAAVRAALGLDRIHLLGHSWGGMLALESALSGAPGLVSPVPKERAGEHAALRRGDGPPPGSAAGAGAGGARTARGGRHYRQ